MNIWHNIKHFFYTIALNRSLEKIKDTKREMINIKSAKTIGVLFNATNTKNAIIATKFADQIATMGIKVVILGYQNSKSKDAIGDNLFDKNNVNWFGKPLGEKIKKFNKQKIDILIGAFIEDSLPLEYLVTTSKSKFRVGAFNNGKTESYELMINISKNTNLEYLLQQILHFLKVINKDEKAV